MGAVLYGFIVILIIGFVLWCAHRTDVAERDRQKAIKAMIKAEVRKARDQSHLE